jgi:hypothetical protein
MDKGFLSEVVPLVNYHYYVSETQIIDYQFFLDLLSSSGIYVS